MNDLKQSLDKLRYAVLAALATLAIISLGVVFMTHHLQQKALAESFAAAARSSLVINDLRQAMFTLNPALRSGFGTVRFEAGDGTTTFALPPTTTAMTSARQLRFAVEVYADPKNPAGGKLGVLEFYYDPLGILKWVALCWIALLAVAFPAAKRAEKSVIARHFELLAMENAQAKARVAKQVAHDIRSPLTAIMMVEKSARGLNVDQQSLLNGAVQRINQIANDLLDQTRADAPVDDPARLIDQIIREKRIALGPDSPVRIEVGALPRTALPIAQAVFGRVLSNLLNNSVEAIDGSGTVRIEGHEDADAVELRIVDTGRGMSADVLERARSGVSVGKEKGNGLGLSYAIEQVRAVGGAVDIRSGVGEGTEIKMRFPRAKV